MDGSEHQKCAGSAAGQFAKVAPSPIRPPPRVPRYGPHPHDVDRRYTFATGATFQSPDPKTDLVRLTQIGRNWHCDSPLLRFRATRCKVVEASFTQAGVEIRALPRKLPGRRKVPLRLSRPGYSTTLGAPVERWQPSRIWRGQISRASRYTRANSVTGWTTSTLTPYRRAP